MSNINEEILIKTFPLTFGGEHSITPGALDHLQINIKIYAYCI